MLEINPDSLAIARQSTNEMHDLLIFEQTCWISSCSSTHVMGKLYTSCFEAITSILLRISLAVGTSRYLPPAVVLSTENRTLLFSWCHTDTWQHVLLTKEPNFSLVFFFSICDTLSSCVPTMQIYDLSSLPGVTTNWRSEILQAGLSTESLTVDIRNLIISKLE